MSAENDELRMKVAELCGWRLDPTEERVSLVEGRRLWWISPNGSRHYHTDIPDYPNDLNACHEFEKTLSGELPCCYINNLWDLLGLNTGREVRDRLFVLTHATAEQRCRAFVATMEANSVPSA